MRRRRVAAALLVVMALVVAGCSSPGDEGSGGVGPGDAGDRDDEAGSSSDASLIPPSDATSPTSGPPNTDPLAGAGEPSGTTCEENGEPSPARVGDDLELRVQLRESLETGRVRWSLTLENTGDATATLVYPTAQDGDVVLRRDGEVAYRWSQDAVFAQQQRCQLIGAGQEYQFNLGGTDLDVEPGDYELAASLAANPAPADARIFVTVDEPDAG